MIQQPKCCDHHYQKYYSQKYLSINKIDILLINLCPIYRAPGLKHLKKTQWDIRIGIFCQKNQGHWWRWCRDSIHDSEEIWPMAPTKNKTWVLQNNVLSQQKFSGPHGNSENNMNQGWWGGGVVGGGGGGGVGWGWGGGGGGWGQTLSTFE